MNQDLNVREKQEVNVGAAESTRNEPLFSPVVDIWESENGLILMADMPGVTAETLSIDLQDNTLTISGQVPVQPAEGRKMLLKEYEVGGFYRQFSLSDSINQDGITASIKDGVLKLTLPRITPAQPRKIQIKTDQGPIAAQVEDDCDC